jgi:hypothetical protein
VPERKDMDYEKVRAIGKEKYCIKGISRKVAKQNGA